MDASLTGVELCEATSLSTRASRCSLRMERRLFEIRKDVGMGAKSLPFGECHFCKARVLDKLVEHLGRG
jgi:hypothetical protein